MTPAVAAEEGDPATLERPGHEGVRRSAEGRIERDLPDVAESLDLVEAGASQDPDIRLGAGVR